MTLLIDLLWAQISAESLLSEAKFPLNYEAMAKLTASFTYIECKNYLTFTNSHLMQNNERYCEIYPVLNFT
jgi:hypothetical protein